MPTSPRASCSHPRWYASPLAVGTGQRVYQTSRRSSDNGGLLGSVDAELGEQRAAVLEHDGVVAITGMVDVDADVDGEAAVAQDQHAVGEADGLVDVVGDEQDA